MGVIYSPVLLITAFLETQQAHSVKSNRKRGEEDDDTIEEWEQLEGEVDFEAEGWTKRVQTTRPNVDVGVEAVYDEVGALKKEMQELKDLIEGMKGAVGDGK